MAGALVPACDSPHGALDEVDALGLGAQPVIALDPEQAPGRVGDGDDHLVRLGVLDQELADHRHHCGQRVGVPVGAQSIVDEVHAGGATVGIDTAAQAAPPGVPDDRAAGDLAGRARHAVARPSYM